MKKLFSLMLVAVLMLGLSASAMAADDTTDIIINVLEDNPITLPFSGSLSGSDFWIETRYGHIQLNDDGSYRYKVDKENPALNAAMESGWGVVDQLVLTFPIWVSRHSMRGFSISINVVPSFSSRPPKGPLMCQLINWRVGITWSTARR